MKQSVKDKLKYQQIQEKLLTWTKRYGNIILFIGLQSPTQFTKCEYALFEKFSTFTNIESPVHVSF